MFRSQLNGNSRWSFHDINANNTKGRCLPSGVRLHVDPPAFRGKMECLQSASLTQELDAISVDIAAVVPSSWLTF